MYCSQQIAAPTSRACDLRIIHQAHIAKSAQVVYTHNSAYCSYSTQLKVHHRNIVPHGALRVIITGQFILDDERGVDSRGSLTYMHAHRH